MRVLAFVYGVSWPHRKQGRMLVYTPRDVVAMERDALLLATAKAREFVGLYSRVDGL